MPILIANYSQINHEEMAASIGLKAKHIPLLVGSFIEETTKLLELLSKAIDVYNFVGIKEHSHSIKGSAGNLKFSEVYEMLKEMEVAAEEFDTDFKYREYYEAIKKSVETIKI